MEEFTWAELTHAHLHYGASNKISIHDLLYVFMRRNILDCVSQTIVHLLPLIAS